MSEKEEVSRTEINVSQPIDLRSMGVDLFKPWAVKKLEADLNILAGERHSLPFYTFRFPEEDLVGGIVRMVHPEEAGQLRELMKLSKTNNVPGLKEFMSKKNHLSFPFNNVHFFLTPPAEDIYRCLPGIVINSVLSERLEYSSAFYVPEKCVRQFISDTFKFDNCVTERGIAVCLYRATGVKNPSKAMRIGQGMVDLTAGIKDTFDRPVPRNWCYGDLRS